MVKNFIILLSLIFPDLNNYLVAGCGDAYLFINDKFYVDYGVYDHNPTFFFSPKDSSEIKAKQIGTCWNSPQIKRVLFNGTLIWWPGINTNNFIRIKNKPGHYDVEVFYSIHAMSYTRMMGFYISDWGAVGVEEGSEVSSELVFSFDQASHNYRIESATPLTHVSIFDLAGKQMSSVLVDGCTFIIQLDNFSRGIYLVHAAIKPEKIIVKKMVVD